ncbi:MAG: class I SAM-dependent methyltransferase [Methanobacteriota archaeon]|nr:MAG: class I SAM-dependent methyltransferase [Euryarchaeota archaeon]
MDLDPFVYRMIETYPKVHTEIYWSNVEPFLKELEDPVFLEIGCGPGLLLRDLYERYNPKKLIGIDLSEDMLTKAKEILHKPFKEGRVELILQHMQQNPTLPNKIDAIFSSRVLRSFEDPYTIFQSIHKSLVKGGYLIVLDWDRQSIWNYASWMKRQKDFGDRHPQEIIRYHRNFSRYSLEDWSYIVANTGFAMSRIFRVNEVHIGFIATKV